MNQKVPGDFLNALLVRTDSMKRGVRFSLARDHALADAAGARITRWR